MDNVLSPQPQTPSQPVVQPIDPKTLPAGLVRQRHLQAGYTMVKFGLASKRPAKTNEVLLYFATDTYVMSYFDPVLKVWKSGSAFT